MQTPTETYIASIKSDFRSGKATEHTYRPALEKFMESLGHGIKASNDPKHIECGAPDFIIEKGHIPLGYVETKDVGSDLNKVEKSDQIQRYQKALHNLILTDYLEFRWYKNGKLERKVRVAEITKDGRLTEVNPYGNNLEQLFRDFYITEAPTVTSPKELANRLASVTHFIREQIIAALNSGDPDLQKSLEGRYNAFKELLLPAIKPEEFADLYAQAMTYGLFAAKLSAPEETRFTLAGAYQFLFGNKFLRRLFSDVSEELDEIDIIRPYLQDIVSLLNRADFASILADFGRRTRTEDPVVHFYETFLAAYDPKLRESRGVYYTPEPVVQFIVRAVDDLLKTRFDKPWGLADPSVKVLDPATGTGTFLYYVIQKVHDEMIERGQAGSWPEKSKELINRIFGFELLIAPYVVSHLKLGLELKNLGAPLEGRDERLQVYLTNSLEEGITKAEQLTGLGSYIAEESNEAARVKKRNDIMVVLGNPPYSANSDNSGKWITNLVKNSYYPHDEIKEQNPKLLLDDYVKFIRFGEWRISNTHGGILAFITNHAYIENPTFREMRKHLLSSFNRIYILNLHGNSKTGEKAPNGRRDINVFDIQQGVSIIIAIKDPNDSDGKQHKPCDIKYASLWGDRENKYSILSQTALSEIDWVDSDPKPPFFIFSPKDFTYESDYKAGWKLTDFMPENSTGIKTHRDHFAIDFEYNSLKYRIADFRNLRNDDIVIRQRYDLLDTRDWKLHESRIRLNKLKEWQVNIRNILYRPFDVRYIFNHSDVVELSRSNNMKNMVYPNLALLGMRRIRTADYSHFFVADKLVGKDAVSIQDACYIFPLYLYTTPNETLGTLFHTSEIIKKPNFSLAFINEFAGHINLRFVMDGQGDLKTTFGPEDVFYYAYAVFHSPTYRTRYAEFLKIDFPRLPLTSDKALFATLVALGKQLVDFHLLKTPKVDEFITTYPVTGNNIVEKVAFSSGNVWINTTQYFGGIPEEVWNFKVGGYQVCEKWLKDRKGRVLSGEEIHHYQRVVVALRETIRLMKEVDEVIPGWPIL